MCDNEKKPLLQKNLNCKKKLNLHPAGLTLSQHVQREVRGKSSPSMPTAVSSPFTSDINVKLLYFCRFFPNYKSLLCHFYYPQNIFHFLHTPSVLFFPNTMDIPNRTLHLIFLQFLFLLFHHYFTFLLLTIRT